MKIAAKYQAPRSGPRLVEQISASPGDDPGPGGWSGGFANQAHWDPARSRDWRCWAQSGPTWSAHCGAEVAADDTLGLCQRHRRSLLDDEGVSSPGLRRGLGDAASLGDVADVPDLATLGGLRDDCDERPRQPAERLLSAS